MKIRCSLFLILFSFPMASYAESPVDKGVYSISGYISYNESDNDNIGKTKTLIASPGFVYFLYPRVGLGASLNYSHSTHGSINSDINEITPFIRYYFSDNGLYPFVSIGYGWGKVKFKDDYSSDTTNSKTINLVIGVNYFISRNVALSPLVSYGKRMQDSSSASSSATTFFGAVIGVNVFIY